MSAPNITEAELAERLGITPALAARRRRALNWPHLRPSHTVVRYTPDQVAAIEASLTVRETPPASARPLIALPGQTARSAARN